MTKPIAFAPGQPANPGLCNAVERRRDDDRSRVGSFS